MRLAILAAATLAACSSIEDVRGYQPVRVAEWPGNYKLVSGCAAERMIGTQEMSYVVREDARRASMVSMIEGYLVIYEATFAEIADDRFKVEMRSAKGLYDIHPTAARTWAAIESCAAKV